MARETMNIEAAKKILLERHAKEVAALEAKAAIVPVVTRNGAYTKKSKKAEPKTAQATAHKVGPDLFGLSLPAKGSINAQEFIMAVRDAGKRAFQTFNMNNEPITVRRVEASKVRDDTILAIAAYVGYDPTGNFGAQELAARNLAAKEIGYAKQPMRQVDGKIASRQEDRIAVAAIGKPYVAGVADHHQKRQAELRGIEALLVDELITQQKVTDSAFKMLCPDGKTLNPMLTLEEQVECQSIYEEHLAEFSIVKGKLDQVRKDIEMNVKTIKTFDD